MADISIVVNSISTQETRAAQHALVVVNARREEQGKQPFANSKAYLEWYINNRLLPAWMIREREDTTIQSDIQRRWKLSSDAQRAAAVAALEPLT